MPSYSFFNSLTDDDFVEHGESLIFSNRAVSSSFTSALGVLGGGFEACGIAVVGVLELLSCWFSIYAPSELGDNSAFHGEL